MEKERLTENLKTQWRKAYGFPAHTEEVSSYAEFLEGIVIKQLDLIQSLYDLQNGPPLVGYEKEWVEVMERINEHLIKTYQHGKGNNKNIRM